MKQIIFFLIITISFSGCNRKLPNTQENKQTKTDEDTDDDGDTDEDKKVKKLKDRVYNKENELEEAEDELNDVEDKLEDIKEKLRTNTQLSTEQRERLQREKTALEAQKSTLQNSINSLNSQIATLRTDLATAESERDTARRERDTARSERDTARTERECWKKTTGDFCTRTSKVVARIIARPEITKTDCAEVNYCDLEKITTLDLSGSYDPSSDSCSAHQLSIQPSDFFGLTKLETLNLSGNCLNTVMGFTASSGFFRGLDSIRRIDLQETGVYKLSDNFFNGILDTLEDGKVLVTDFTYCSSPESSYKSKLGEREGANENFVGTAVYSRTPNFDATQYCY